MKFWTVHVLSRGALRHGPELVPERFSLGAAVLGPVWLLAHRAYVPGLLSLAVVLLLATWMAGAEAWPIWLAYAWGSGLFGQDFRRWSLARRGYVMTQVVAARDEEAALGRLLAGRPELAALLS